jgi:transcriptional regulator with XRE-family HTH domain
MPSAISEVSAAIRALRTSLGESQQAFAWRMKTAIRTIARYETRRPPKGLMLASFLHLAVAAGQPDLAGVFRKALYEEIERTYGLTPAALGDLLRS